MERRLLGPQVITFAFCLNDYYLWLVLGSTVCNWYESRFSWIRLCHINIVNLCFHWHLINRNLDTFSNMSAQNATFENVSFEVTLWQVRWPNLKFLKSVLPTTLHLRISDRSLTVNSHLFIIDHSSSDVKELWQKSCGGQVTWLECHKFPRDIPYGSR